MYEGYHFFGPPLLAHIKQEPAKSVIIPIPRIGLHG